MIAGNPQDFVFNVVVNPEMKSGLEISVDNDLIEISMNKEKAFRVLENRKIIIAALNKKLDELVERKISKLAREEEQLEKGK